MKHTTFLKQKQNQPKLFAEFNSSILHKRLLVSEQLFTKNIVSIVLPNKKCKVINILH